MYVNCFDIMKTYVTLRADMGIIFFHIESWMVFTKLRELSNPTEKLELIKVASIYSIINPTVLPPFYDIKFYTSYQKHVANHTLHISH